MSDGEVNGVCPALPSSTTVHKLFAGDEHALGLLVRDFAVRCALVSVGCYLMGLRGDALMRAAIGGAGGIEAFVMIYAWWDIGRARRAAAGQPPTVLDRFVASLSDTVEQRQAAA